MAMSMIIVISVVAVAAVTQSNFKEDTPEPTQVKADIVMPTKVSRPGCEEIDHCYVPSKITVSKGEPVVWRNEDAAFHSVTSGSYGEPTGLFDSGYLDPYESFSFTFDDPGTYDYYCTLHPWMKGQVVVE